MRNSSVHSLHQYLSNVYCTVLFGQSKESGKSDTQLRDLLYSLRAGLQKSIRKGAKTLQQTDFSQDEFKSILSPLDEIECWQELERDSGNDDRLQKKAEIITQAFSRIASPISELDTLELGQISALVDNLQDALDQIWTNQDMSPAYPQARMEHFF